MLKSVREENESQQFTERVVDEAGKQRVQGDLTGRGLKKSTAAVITQHNQTRRFMEYIGDNFLTGD